MVQPINQAEILGAGRELVPDYAEQAVRQALLGVQQQNAQTQHAQEERLNRGALREELAEAEYQRDLEAVFNNPTANGFATLAARHPRFSESAARSFRMKKDWEQQADLTEMSEIYSAARSGKTHLAAQLMRRRIDADLRGVGAADPMDEAVLSALESEDPQEHQAVLSMLTPLLSAIVGPERFSSAFGAMTRADEPADFQQYALALGLEPGSEEYNAALQDYVLRAQGPTAQDNRQALEHLRQGHRENLEGVRQRHRERLEGIREDNRRSRPTPERAPSPTSVIGRILAKQAEGAALTPGEQRILSDYNSRRGGTSRGRGRGNSAVIVNPQTGQRLELRNGQWVPIQ